MGFLYVKTADGKKRASVWVWILLLIILLGASVFLVTNKRETGLEQMIKGQDRGPDPQEAKKLATEESNKNSEDMDAEAVNKMNEQIEREKEENGGWISDDRESEIREKYVADLKNRDSTNFKPTVDKRLQGFMEPEPAPPAPAPQPIAQSKKQEAYMTLNERLKAEGIDEKGKGSQNRATEFGEKKRTEKEKQLLQEKEKTILTQESKIKNLLPMGTFIPCVLESDIVTSDLTSYVWATVVLDVTFRRQLQLPKGLVKLRGKTAAEPVQNLVDIYFDVMIFSDGTELPISGYAYAAFDPRYPTRFKIRGVPGEMIVPPLYVKLQSLVYSAALGASDAYIQNYINENTSTPSTFTTVPTIDPVTGQVQNVIQQQQGQPVNNNIGGTVGLSAGQAALEDLVEKAKEDLEKYRPYVTVEKGSPIFVQLDETVDVSKRQVNGVKIAQSIAEQEAAAKGKKSGNQTEIYPPGDARAKYTGSRPSTDAGGVPGGIAGTASSFLDTLKSTDPAIQAQLEQAQQKVDSAKQGGQSSSNDNSQLQAILNNMGN